MPCLSYKQTSILKNSRVKWVCSFSHLSGTRLRGISAHQCSFVLQLSNLTTLRIISAYEDKITKCLATISTDSTWTNLCRSMVERNKDMSWPSFVAFILEEAEVEGCLPTSDCPPDPRLATPPLVRSLYSLESTHWCLAANWG